MRVNNSERYRLRDGAAARSVARDYLRRRGLDGATTFGLPEVDDRFDVWRVPVLSKAGGKVGEVVVDAISTLVDESKTTRQEVMEDRLLGRRERTRRREADVDAPRISMMGNSIRFGDAEELLQDMPAEGVNLVFTSPPYYNAKPEYVEYLDYEAYLLKMRRVIHECARVLSEGRFFVLNVSPVLQRRANRNESSKRIAVPFDFHRLFMEEGFEFVDDIIWVKPEGAGWATGRGRRFSADRNPLQYKPVPVTEYVLVYRKKSDKLIDWLIHKHPDQQALRESKIEDGYDVTNVWHLTPAHHKSHPAVFPQELAEKVIRYYSIKNDVVLDPFAGTGTTAKAAVKLGRHFCLLEKEPKYMELLVKDFGEAQELHIDWVNVAVKEESFANLFTHVP